MVMPMMAAFPMLVSPHFRNQFQMIPLRYLVQLPLSIQRRFITVPTADTKIL